MSEDKISRPPFQPFQLPVKREQSNVGPENQGVKAKLTHKKHYTKIHAYTLLVHSSWIKLSGKVISYILGKETLRQPNKTNHISDSVREQEEILIDGRERKFKNGK